MRVFVDAGGTRTRLWAEDEHGRVLRRRDFASDPRRLPSRIRAFLNGRRAGILVLGLRGMWTTAERRQWAHRVRRFSDQLAVLSDIEFAHFMAFAGGPGIVLNAGTGSIAFGRGARGRTARAGGLGPLLGDDGSAFWIGREFLRRSGKPASAIRPFAVAADAVRRIAALAPAVLRSAGRNAAARAIVAEAQAALVALVLDAARRIGAPRGTPVALTGGLFQNRGFRRGVERRLRREGFTATMAPAKNMPG